MALLRATVAESGADFIESGRVASTVSSVWVRLLGPIVAGFSKQNISAVLTRALVVALFAASRPAFADPLADANAAVGRGDFTAAAPLYRTLADKGNVAAQKQLGYLYEIGAGVERDWVKAAEWYGKAADTGDDSAAAALGYLGRNWVRMNPGGNQAIYALVEKAAKMGNAKAQFTLGLMNYRIGDLSFDKASGNLDEALVWYRRAADQGDVDSEVVLALAYAKGIGVEKSEVEAYKWYDIAASLAKYADVKDDVVRRRNELARAMSPSQIEEAKKLAADWKPRPNR
jgi:TPR repeat protein